MMQRVTDPRQKVSRLQEIIFQNKEDLRAWIHFRRLSEVNPEVKEILNQVESDRLDIAGNAIEGLGIKPEKAKEKALGFMYIFFGWLVLNMDLKLSTKKRKDEFRRLLELLGLQAEE